MGDTDTRTDDIETLPVDHTAESDRNPCVTVMTGHGRDRNQKLFVFDGPEGGELVIPFDRVRYDADTHRLVLTRLKRDGHSQREIGVFRAEHWGQWGDVSEWFETNGIPDVPRRFR